MTALSDTQPTNLTQVLDIIHGLFAGGEGWMHINPGMRRHIAGAIHEIRGRVGQLEQSAGPAADTIDLRHLAAQPGSNLVVLPVRDLPQKDS
ncbi:hypothetical protein [Camelimonas lactis]|uniref:Uncharacterized protein n=1 Tax=Camelimonas lactis TaxID=659006 RepID=A0A4R2GW40_9HYPH|nr:hypothetical protein [Camelimonas lactis]TCO15209.1 hypothetical protein EV666_102187 [Camelimonas lactis]